MFAVHRARSRVGHLERNRNLFALLERRTGGRIRCIIEAHLVGTSSGLNCGRRRRAFHHLKHVPEIRTM